MAQDGKKAVAIVAAGSDPGGNYGKFVMDPLVRDLKGAALEIHDVPFKGGWKGGVPVNGDVVQDISGNEHDAAVVGSLMTLLKQGFNHSAATGAGGAYVEGTAHAAAAIRAQDADEYLMTWYGRLPIAANFNTTSTPLPFMGSGNYQTGAMLADITQYTGGGNRIIGFRRQTGPNTIGAVAAIAVPAADLVDAGDGFGAFCQLATWRKDGVTRGSYRTAANGPTVATGETSGSDNTVDFSACKFNVGVGPNFWSNSAPALLANNFASHRWSVAALRLATEVLDIPAILAADWARVNGRYPAW